MTEEPLPSSPTPPPGGESRSDASVVTQFFLLPLAVVAGLTGIFFLYMAVTRHPPTPADHLRTLRTGRFNQRWQAAFDLSSLLRDGEGVREDTSVRLHLRLGLAPRRGRIGRSQGSPPGSGRRGSVERRARPGTTWRSRRHFHPYLSSRP